MELNFFEILKVIFLGIVEGITEWLPISSTGHMLLVDEFLQINASEAFKEMFFVVIQLGAIMAVVLIFWNKMWPFNLKYKSRPFIKNHIFDMWFKVVVACIPGAVVTILFDDYIEAHFHTPLVIAATLIIYGILFIVIENRNKNVIPDVKKLSDITYKHALLIGLFQVLSIIPGTSRSGSTIIGALLIGVSRVAAAEFTFFLAVPVMFGLSALKLLKFGFAFTSAELIILLVGCLTAFIVSLFVISFLMSYIKKKDFKAFGWYRIILGVIVIAYFMIFG
ncbi:MAG: undecaprenyl-diphosphate phosphatase, partial [Ruminococcaceae bacterium]|nr:undecaprenyl-diphosphate phosphatase [Oscillospiraceae bacterium]